MNNLKSVILIIQIKEMTGEVDREIIDTAIALNYFLTIVYKTIIPFIFYY